MKKPHAMLVSIDSYRGGTEGMPSKFRGPYFDLLCAIFDAGGAVLNKPDVLARAARIEPRAFAKFWADWQHKFIISDGHVRHHKIDEVLDAYCKKVAKLQQNGSKGGRKTQQKQRKPQAIAKATQPNGLGTTYVVPQPLAPDGALAFERLRAACAESGHQTIELERLGGSIEGWSDGTFYLPSRYAVDTFTERLGPVLRSENIKLAVKDASGSLKAIQGGKS